MRLVLVRDQLAPKQAVFPAISSGIFFRPATFQSENSRVSPSMIPAIPQTVNTEAVDTHNKALKVNLDPRWYGSFAEIGAGQEVVRWFFRVGGAAGTISKSISAYDMKVSDAIYGQTERYVARKRLQS